MLNCRGDSGLYNVLSCFLSPGVCCQELNSTSELAACLGTNKLPATLTLSDYDWPEAVTLRGYVVLFASLRRILSPQGCWRPAKVPWFCRLQIRLFLVSVCYVQGRHNATPAGQRPPHAACSHVRQPYLPTCILATSLARSTAHSKTGP